MPIFRKIASFVVILMRKISLECRWGWGGGRFVCLWRSVDASGSLPMALTMGEQSSGGAGAIRRLFRHGSRTWTSILNGICIFLHKFFSSTPITVPKHTCSCHYQLA